MSSDKGFESGFLVRPKFIESSWYYSWSGDWNKSWTKGWTKGWTRGW